jgi:hypothetical protein
MRRSLALVVRLTAGRVLSVSDALTVGFDPEPLLKCLDQAPASHHWAVRVIFVA